MHCEGSVELHESPHERVHVAVDLDLCVVEQLRHERVLGGVDLDLSIVTRLLLERVHSAVGLDLMSCFTITFGENLWCCRVRPMYCYTTTSR